MSETKSKLDEQTLQHFTGTEFWYRHALFSRFTYTDGVKYVAEQGGAYWLLDKIFACQHCVPALTHHNFTVWELVLDASGDGARLICTDGNENRLYRERIVYTDFPLQRIKFYFQNGVLLLPSEY